MRRANATIHHLTVSSERQQRLSQCGERMVKSKPFRDYLKMVSKRSTGLSFGNNPLAMEILVYPPDNRRRDLDNLRKVLCDSLQAAGFYKDDSQIDDLHFKRMNAKNPGCVVVEMKLLSRET